MKQMLEINIGDIFGDLKCIGKMKTKNGTKYIMECIKCHRTKNMLSSTIRLKKGILHSSCGEKGLKTKNKIFYSRWTAMRNRTTNPNYTHYNCYGGRGISSEYFKNFIDFYDTMYDSFVKKSKEIGEENTSLDRIDVNKDYCPANCRWVHINEQQGNQRKTIEFIVTFPDGHKEINKNVSKFARDNKLDDQSIYDCLNNKYKQYKHFKFEKLINKKCND